MTKRLAFFTVSDPRYADMSYVLFENVKSYYPEAELFLVMLGEGDASQLDNGTQIIYAQDIVEAEDFQQRLCFYLDVELATSLRPHCFQHLFDQGFDQVIYLDPDLYVFRRMTEIDDLLASGINGVVTPHSLRSITDMNAAIAGGDKIFLQVGIFNLGFLALNRSPESIRMVAWWRKKLKWECVADQKNGLFVDQRWLEFLPVYFEGFHILRLPTYNLAPWNAEHYSVFKYGDAFFIDTLSQPVAFIHFSGVKRSKAHFRDMAGAHEFYMRKLNVVHHDKNMFLPYVLRLNKSDLPWDKIFTFLYKDYIGLSKDIWNTPLDNDAFYNYATGIDEAVGITRYLVKVFELYPRFAAQILFTGGEITYDNLENEILNVQSPYHGVVNIKTIAHLKQSAQLPETVVPRLYSSNTSLVVNSDESLLRRTLKRSRLALRAYATCKSTISKIFNIQQNLVVSTPAPAGSSEEDRKRATITAILLRKASDTEYSK